MFCRHCGNEIDSESAFCSHCGSPIGSEPEVLDQAQQDLPKAEPAQWVFRAQRKFSMFKIMPCSIVFFKNRLVLAHLSPALQKAEGAKASAEIKEKGLGFLKGTGEMMRFWSNHSQRYYTMGIDEILLEDPANMVIDQQDIVKVLFRGYSSSGGSDDTGTTGKLEFDLAGGDTIKFSHSYASGKEVKESLTNLFGAKLKYKR